MKQDLERVNTTTDGFLPDRYREQALNVLFKAANVPAGKEEEVMSSLAGAFDTLYRMAQFRGINIEWYHSAGDLMGQYYKLQEEGPDPMIELMARAVNGEFEVGRAYIATNGSEAGEVHHDFASGEAVQYAEFRAA